MNALVTAATASAMKTARIAQAVFNWTFLVINCSLWGAIILGVFTLNFWLILQALLISAVVFVIQMALGIKVLSLHHRVFTSIVNPSK